MKNQILILMILGILFSCSKDDDNQSEVIEMRINHFQNTGIAVGPVLTLLIQKGDNIGTDNWTKFYSNIQGFNYEPGTIYNLSVKVEPIDNPPLDGVSAKYTLIKIVSTQEVDNETLFDIDLKKYGENFVTTNTGFELLNQIDIDCNNLCNELETMLQNQDFVVGTFKRGSNNEIKLMGLK
ncbi:DUF4377 domain-containing protein [Maribellus sp. YY47]|uniref:DUF4377 domain-containing protein n=1 Tax=Maribellus sp. YY47 TaxID=2929486 RepID=UPI0020019AC7|nr:DUF4377 domain-containing protein [Maribellus sp. YY47]MCK3686314.1 DUF4377 domain-containing protein [Maribellus sp. YY47]